MRHLFKALVLPAALVGAALLAPVASAADFRVPVLVPALPPAVTPDWNGFYIGAHMGLMASESKYDYAGDFTGNLTNHTRIGLIHGSAPGLYGGYNYRFGSIVLGAEGDATFTDGMFRLNGANFDALQFSNKVYTGSGRVGYLTTPNTLVYGKVGYSRIELSGLQNFTQFFHQSVGGVQYAVGVENLITDNVMLRLEAAYTNASQDLKLNQGFDHYRPSFLWVNAGLAFKLDPLPRYKSTVEIPTYVSPEPRWTSVHVAGMAGIASGQVTRYDPIAGLIGPYNDIHFTGGFAAGADVQFLKYFVVGAGFDELFLHSTFDDDVGQGLAPPFVHRFAEINRIYSITGRAGVLVTPSTLIYGKVGFARMLFAPQAAYFHAVNPTVPIFSSNLPAFQAGLGTEAMVADHIAVRIEGLYTRADRPIVIDGVQPAQFTLQPSAFTATAGLVLKY